MRTCARAPAARRLHAHEPVQVVSTVRAPVRPAAVQRAQHPVLVAGERSHLHHISIPVRVPPQPAPQSQSQTELPARHGALRNPSHPSRIWSRLMLDPSSSSIPFRRPAGASPVTTYKSRFTQLVNFTRSIDIWTDDRDAVPIGASRRTLGAASGPRGRRGRGIAGERPRGLTAGGVLRGARTDRGRAGPVPARRACAAGRRVRPEGIEPSACGLKDRTRDAGPHRFGPIRWPKHGFAVRCMVGLVPKAVPTADAVPTWYPRR